MVSEPRVPLVVLRADGRRMFGFVNHRNRDVDNAFLRPRAPVLINAPVSFCRVPGRFSGADSAESDERGGYLDIGFDSDGVQINAPHNVRHLVAAPLIPLRVVLRGSGRAERDVVVFLKSFDARRIVADAGAAAW